MSTARQKRKPVFDPSALDEDLDDLWPARPAAAAAPQTAPAAEPIAAAPATPASAERPSKAALPPAASQPTRDSAAAQTRPSQTPATKPVNGAPSDQPRHLATVTAAPGSVRKRTRPPEVLLSSEVYDELYRVQIAEKKVRRGLARTMGAIVLDADRGSRNTVGDYLDHRAVRSRGGAVVRAALVERGAATATARNRASNRRALRCDGGQRTAAGQSGASLGGRHAQRLGGAGPAV